MILAFHTPIRRSLSTEFHGLGARSPLLPTLYPWNPFVHRFHSMVYEGHSAAAAMMGGYSGPVLDRDAPNKWLVTAAVVCGTLCIGVTMSMMNLAVPLMLSALRTDIDTIQWIITGPMLVNIALVPLVSWLTALIGTRRVYLWAIAIWIATSLPCGLSDTASGVIFYRLLQGVGGSLHIPTVITVMYQAFPFHQRGLAMGIQQGAQWAAPAIGMTLGGYLLHMHGWRALFFYPIPIGLISIGLALWVIPNTRDGTRTPLDWGGLATLTPALTLWLIAVSQSQRPGWGRHDLLLLTGAGLICTVAFALVERRQKAALIEFGLFRERAFGAASVVYFLNTFTGMGVSFAVIVFLQHGLDYSPLQVGFLLLPAMLGRVAGELTAGHLSDRWGARGLSLAGLLIFAISSAALGQVDQQSSRSLIGALLLLGHTGMGLSNSPIIHVGLQTLREERISMGSGLLSLIRITGGTFGVGVVGPLVAMAERWGDGAFAGGAAASPIQATALVSGYHNYFYLMALVILCTMIPACLVHATSRSTDR
jgi:EmrB/QacA subfamily drug resistance transporter